MKQTLFLTLGYPGAGKTTASKLIAELTGAEHIWADKYRRELFEQPTYSHEENIMLYNKLNMLAEALLKQGKSLIFDTNFNFYKDRQKLKQIADDAGAQTILIWVQTPKEVAKQRAVDDAHLHSQTRVLGHMPESHFERITNNLETPKSDEKTIILQGTKINQDYAKQALQTADIL